MKISNIAELKTRRGTTGFNVDVLGYYSAGDGGGDEFYWDNTSIETDNGGTIIKVTGLTTGRWKRVCNRLTPKKFGAKADGITDDTSSIQSLLTSNLICYFDNGLYKAQNIVMRDGNIIYGNGATIRAFSGANPVISIHDNCQIYSLTINGNKSATSSGSSGIFCANKTNFHIENCKIFDTFNQGIQIQNSTTFIVKGNTIYDCGGIGATQYQGINMVFSSYGVISSNTVYNCQHGIQYFGDNTTRCLNLNIIGNIAHDVEAGIWGAYGKLITVNANSVYSCSDVGIDFEYTINSSASANVVNDCVNGCLSTFYGSSYISFSNNICVQAPAYPCIKIHGLIASLYISILGNNLKTEGVGIESDTATLGKSIISENTIESTGIAILVREADELNITNNTIYTAEIGISRVGGNNGVVIGNTIRKTTSDISTDPNLFGGIKLDWTPSNNTRGNTISKNNVYGYNYSIVDNCWGDVTSYNLISDNRCTSIYRRVGGGYAGKITNNVSTVNPNTAISETTF